MLETLVVMARSSLLIFALKIHVALCSHFFCCSPTFYTCIYWSCLECFVKSLGSDPNPPPVWCEMPRGFAAVAFAVESVQGTDVDTVQCVCAQMWRAEESLCLYSQVPPNPRAHSSNEDFQLWDGISPWCNEITTHYRSINGAHHVTKQLTLSELETLWLF